MRRAIAIGTLISIILALIVLGMGGFLLLKLQVANYADASLCSGTGFSLRAFSLFDDVTVSEIDDPTGVLDLCPARLVAIGERRDDAHVNRMLTEQLLLCHKTYGGGQVNLFRPEGRNTNTRYCGLCAKIDFEENTNEPIEGFEEYLATTVVPGTGKTAGQILNEGIPNLGEINEAVADEPDSEVLIESTLDRSTDYGVVYVYDKRTAVADNFFQAAAYGLAGGSVGGAVASRAGRAYVARLAAKAGARRVLGLAFGPWGWAISVADAAAGGVAGVFTVASHPGTYLDQWMGGPIIVKWDTEDDESIIRQLGCEVPQGWVSES